MLANFTMSFSVYLTAHASSSFSVEEFTQMLKKGELWKIQRYVHYCLESVNGNSSETEKLSLIGCINHAAYSIFENRNISRKRMLELRDAFKGEPFYWEFWFEGRMFVGSYEKATYKNYKL